MSKYIDAEWLEENAKEYSLGYYDYDEWATPISLLDEAPSIDIVRCKECKFWVEDGNESFGYAMFCEHDCSLGGQGIKKPNDFCSYGERNERC